MRARRGENPPVRIVVVARLGRRIERKPRAVQADQAVGQLVLYRLELTDELAELLPDLGVIHGKVERPLGRAERPAGAGEPCHQRDVRQGFGRHCPATAQAASSRVSSQNGGTARPGVACIVRPGASLCDHGDAGRRLR